MGEAMKKLVIDPITRLEGHGKISIFLNDQGEVEKAFFQVPELRGFEKFCQGRPVEELPNIVNRICGVCPAAHHMASSKAADAVYGLDIPSTAKKLRELFYMAHFIHSHLLHFYFLAAPDFVVGPMASPAQRNILGVVSKVGLEIAGEVIKHRSYGQKIQEIISKKATHPCWSLPGGVSIGLSEDNRKKIQEMGESCLDFSKKTLSIFEDVVLKNKEYVDLILSDPYKLVIHNMGLVDKNNKVNFYEGQIRIVDAAGKELYKFAPADYLEYIAEHVEPWSYLKFPFLKKIGWNGFDGGSGSGIYRVAPLARLNAADGMATPLAQAEYERMFETLGGKPINSTLAMHWARLVELIYAAERLNELIADPEITGDNFKMRVDGVADEGVGVVEAPRGTLIHHYKTDEKGIVEKLNIIVGTTNNHAAICMSIRNAARGVIKKGVEPDQAILNLIEMAFRAYDPCFSCATHSLPGMMPLVVDIRDKEGNIIKKISKN